MAMLAAAVVVPVASGAAAVDGVERTLTVTGVVERVIVERSQSAPVGTADPGAQTRLDVDGAVYDLPAGLALNSRTGDRIVVTLRAAPSLTVAQALKEIAVPDPTDQAQVVSAVPIGGQSTATATTGDLSAVTLGAQTLTVLPVYWDVPDAATVSGLSAVATDAARYWATQSSGRIAVSPSVRAWAKIPDPGTCDSTAIFSNALVANGSPTVSDTQHVLVYFPQRSDCGGWAGIATVGGGKVWVNGVPIVDVFAHELGHNFGLGHANTMTCTAGGARVAMATPVTASCVSQPYGDWADVMGIGLPRATGNLNSAFADYLGFAAVTDVTAGPVSSSVQIWPLASTSNTRAVKLTTGDGTLYVDYRPAVAPDTRMPGWAGVQIHLRRMENGVPFTYLLDMNAPTMSQFANAALATGSSWDVPGMNVRITTQATGATATLGVTPASTPVAQPQISPVYRFWSPLFDNAHFFTTSEDEAAHIRATDTNWVYEGVAFSSYAASAGTCTAGTTAVHRFYSQHFQSHFYTSSDAEKESIQLNDPNWVYEGVAYCGSPTLQPGTTALYRFWSPRFGKHFYTASPAEAHQLDVNDPNWDYEGIAYYVLP
jgi:Repeat of unknown function (DUF5648)